MNNFTKSFDFRKSIFFSSNSLSKSSVLLPRRKFQDWIRKRIWLPKYPYQLVTAVPLQSTAIRHSGSLEMSRKMETFRKSACGNRGKLLNSYFRFSYMAKMGETQMKKLILLPTDCLFGKHRVATPKAIQIAPEEVEGENQCKGYPSHNKTRKKKPI